MSVGKSSVDQARAQGGTATLREFVQQIRSIRKQRWGDPTGYLLIGPAVVFYVVFNIYPVFRGLEMAFMDMQYLKPASANFFVSFNGLDNYLTMFQDPEFLHSLQVSVEFSLLYLPAAIILALVVAVLIGAMGQNPVAIASRVVMYVPVVIPISVTMLMFKSLYDPRLGYVNYILTRLPFIHQGPDWLGDTRWALLALAIATIWTRFGYFGLLFLIGVYQINGEIYEAAAMDGANSFRKFWHITIPSLRPIFVLILVLTGGILSATQEPLILTNGGPGDTTTTLGLYIWQTAFQIGNLRVGYAASMAFLLGVVQILFAFIVFRFLGLKGDA
ncbi:MAG TPA: sugar ABC transporter permease [Chloroflexota bacterium]|nr:sugar ABC transporter permease [Chloroflexota bacterium]